MQCGATNPKEKKVLRILYFALSNTYIQRTTAAREGQAELRPHSGRLSTPNAPHGGHVQHILQHLENTTYHVPTAVVSGTMIKYYDYGRIYKECLGI